MMKMSTLLLPAVEEECYWVVKGTAADTEVGLKTDVDTDDAPQTLPLALDNQQSTAEMKMIVAVKMTNDETEESGLKTDTEEVGQKTDAEEAWQKTDDNHAAVRGTLMMLHQTTMEAKMKPMHLRGPDSMEQIPLPLLDKIV
jgi:hypothetical protein